MHKGKLFFMFFIVAVISTGLLYGISLPGKTDIKFSIEGYEAFFEDNATYTFTVEKSGDANMAGTVDFDFSGNATYGQDYINIGGTSGATTTNGTISFASGETSKTITVTIVDDLLDEVFLELIIVSLSNPTADGGTASLAILKKFAIKTIKDNDPQPEVTLSVNKTLIPEKGGVATVTATLNTVSDRIVALTMKFDGTATCSADYIPSSFIIVINPGATEGSITLTAIDDLLDDDNETIIVDLFISLNADEVGQQSVTVVIANEPPYLSKIPDVVTLEDQNSSKVNFLVDDEDDPASTLRVYGWALDKGLIPDDGFTFYGDGKDRAFRVTPGSNQTGQTKAWIKVFDGENWTARSFFITVIPKNDPPGPGQEPDPVVFDEDETDSLFLAPYVHDPDNDPSDLRWTVTVIQEMDGEGQLPALLSYYKSCFVIFDENVPLSNLLKDTSQTDTWVIIPQESPITEGAAFDTLHVASLDQVNGLFVSIVRATTETFFYGSPNFYDSQIPLLFTATDPWNAFYSFTMIVTINPINDPPVFQEPLPTMELTAGETVQADWGLKSFVTDVDNASSALSFQVSNSEHITVALQSDTLVLVALSGWAGTENLEVIVSDGELTDTTQCEVTVIPENIPEQMEFTDLNAMKRIPSEYMLRENYPNPFNPVTTIEYAIPKYAHVTISVYNMMGQSVQVLVNEFKEPGYYSLAWDASRLSSGMYFYQIQTDDYQFMRRCILLK